MIIETHCMSCGIVIGHLWEMYTEKVKEFAREAGEDPNFPNKQARGKAMDAIGLKKTCCRQSMLSHIPLAHKLRNRYQD